MPVIYLLSYAGYYAQPIAVLSFGLILAITAILTFKKTSNGLLALLAELLIFSKLFVYNKIKCSAIL